ncbi:hypothetical protein ACFE04_009075 [Oxalis oulophora]
MAKGPGLYTDIGKKARDLLYRDFNADQKFSVTTFSSTGVAITSAATKRGDFFLADVTTLLKNKNVTTSITVDTSSNLLTTITVDEPAPGVKAIVSAIVPDQKSGRVELQYVHDYAGISTSVGLAPNPIVNISGVIGSNFLALGADVSFDTKARNFTKCNTGLSFINEDLVASLTLGPVELGKYVLYFTHNRFAMSMWLIQVQFYRYRNNKGESVNASYYHIVDPLTNAAVGAEVSHSFSTKENTITVGTQYSLDPLTTLKARVNNANKVSALIQHEWRPKSTLTISGELDAISIDKSPKFGLALALKP